MSSIRTLVLALGLVLTLNVGTAWAGGADAQPVTIHPKGLVEGTLHGARHSSDAIQFIGCRVRIQGGGVTRIQQLPPEVLCQARDSLGTTAECTSTDPNFVQVALSISDFDSVRFQADAAGNCILLNVGSWSDNLPEDCGCCNDDSPAKPDPPGPKCDAWGALNPNYHPVSTKGGPLDPACSSCVASVCAADPYCCSTYWDSICIGLVDTACDEDD